MSETLSVSEVVTIGNALRDSEPSKTFFSHAKTFEEFPSWSRKHFWVGFPENGNFLE